MKWKAEILFCAIAIAFMADAAAQSNSQPIETNRSDTIPTIKGTIGIADGTSTNWTFQVLLPNGNMTNITVYGFTHNPTNTLFEWIRPDGTRTNIPVGSVPGLTPRRPLPEFINSPTRFQGSGKFQPVGDFWLPGEFENLDKTHRRNEQRRSELR